MTPFADDRQRKAAFAAKGKSKAVRARKAPLSAVKNAASSPGSQDTCRSCGDPNDGDGWAGNCGNCADREVMQSAAKLLKKHEASIVAILATDLEGFLPNELAELKVVSLDAWDDIALQIKLGEHLDLPDDDLDINPDTWTAAYTAAMKAKVTEELQARGFRVVPTRRDMMRLLAAEGELEEEHLDGFEDIIESTNANVGDAAQAVLNGKEAYTIRQDGTVVHGAESEGRYVTLKEA